jgi:hypothetical protein
LIELAAALNAGAVTAQPDKPQCKITNEIKENVSLVKKSGTVRPTAKPQKLPALPK